MRATRVGCVVLLGLLSMVPAAHAGEPDRGQPNVVLIMTDDQSYRSIEKMSYVSGRSDWVRFDNAFFNNPLCCPSRATTLTGQYSHHTGVEDNDSGKRLDDRSTIATWLDDGGYRTGFFGKYLNGYPWDKGRTYIPPGWDEWSGTVGGGKYFDWTANQNGKVKHHGSDPPDYSTDVFRRQALRFVSDTDKRRPFFLYMAPKAPHGPSTAAPRHEGTFADEPIEHSPAFDEEDVSDKPAYIREQPRVNRAASEQRERDEYEALQAVDEAVAAVFGRLKDRGELGETMVIYMTDNSVSRGDHRWTEKRCEYEACIRNPLRIRYPSIGGRGVESLVSNVDLAPTIADVAEVHPAAKVDGQSLLPLMKNPGRSWPDEVLLRGKVDPESGTAPSYWGVRTERYKYVTIPSTDERELYDLTVDPFELENAAYDPAYSDVRAQLADRLKRLKREEPHRLDR